MKHTIKRSGTIHLGKQGEHQARELALSEFAVWEKEYGPGEAEIIFLPAGEKTPVSIAPARTEDGVWLWRVTAAETACSGYGKCELRYTAGDAVVMSTTYQTYVAESLGEGVPVPDTNPDGTQREGSIGMPLLIDEKSGIPYALTVENGRLTLREEE